MRTVAAHCAGARVKNPLFASWIWSIPFLCLQKYLAGAQWRRLSGILSPSGDALGRPRFSPDVVRFERRGAIFRIIATETFGSRNRHKEKHTVRLLSKKPATQTWTP